MTTFRILTLNNISHQALLRFTPDRRAVGKHVEHPDAILVRSHDMHAMTIPTTVKAIGVPAREPTIFRWPRCPTAECRCSTRPAQTRMQSENSCRCAAADRSAQSRSGAAVCRRAAARCDRLRGARRGRQEAIRRHRTTTPHARDHRPGRDRRAGGGHGAEARHEGGRIRPGNHGRCRGGCNRPCARRRRSTKC